MSAKLTKVVVTDRPKAPPNKKILDTPPGDDDVQVIVMGWFRQAIVRTVRTYLQNLAGALTNVGTSGTVAVTAFANLTPEQQATLKQVFSGVEFWQVLVIAASSAIAPAFWTFLMNAIELTFKIDKPETRA